MFLIKRKNFGQENFGESPVICQIRQNFLPSKFCIVRYYDLNSNPQSYILCTTIKENLRAAEGHQLVISIDVPERNLIFARPDN